MFVSQKLLEHASKLMSDKDCRIIYEIFFAAFYLQKTLKSKAVVKMHL